jgi:UDP-N-acetylmuramate: L-alanyl-gamma-D-glutamyl-meso-diaminopimelate ligase
MKVHFIAVGGSVMHNLAIALHKKGHTVTGSDDEIFEPSRSRLARYGLLPENDGWDTGRITSGLDFIVLGMHAKDSNPELNRARELGLKIFSFPEYIYEQTKSKTRIVVAGSHGKTTTTAMIMHVLSHAGIKFDYMAGSLIDGYETMVGLSDDSEIAVLEGDEYLTSAIDKRPKFHLYHPDIAIVNGIAWDHMNVFPTFGNYVDQFRVFIEKITQNGRLIYFEGDREVQKLALSARKDIKKIPYNVHPYTGDESGFMAIFGSGKVPVKIFGEHNMQNLSAVKEACLAAGVGEDDFYSAITSFEGTAKRLQKLNENAKGVVYLDFAHSPSKVKATVEAVAARYPGKKLIACLELHTFSSLNIDFLPLYRNCLDKASESFIYFNPHAISLKGLPPLTPGQVKESFGMESLRVFDDSSELFSTVQKSGGDNTVYLLMSSGDFDGIDMKEMSVKLL